MTRRLLREPLVHFLAAGGLLFAVYGVWRGFGPAGATATAASADRTITVDQATLLNFLQYRSKAFETEHFTSELDAMTAEQRKELADQFVEEEMLYREARALGLEQGDYVIRQRLVQKMRFLMNDLLAAARTPTENELNTYMRVNQDRYRIEAAVTFTHVFVDAASRGDAPARQVAEQLKSQLNARHAGFNDAPQYGDRFPFLRNYVERTRDYVASQFGDAFAAALEQLPTSETTWVGPLSSSHGYHVVLVTRRSESRLPSLAEVRTQVTEDWEIDRTERARAEAMRRLAAQYTVDRADRPDAR